jgi:hypothetical protein
MEEILLLTRSWGTHSSDSEEFCRPEYSAVYCVESEAKSRMKILCLFGSSCCLLHDSFLFGLLFNPEEGGDRTFS